jgi:hypothetical protein
MSRTKMWMGRSIEELDRRELVVALEAALRLLRSVASASLLGSDVEVRETETGTVVGRTFNWAFIPAGHLWTEQDRQEVQTRLNEFAQRHGLQGATVRFGLDRLDVAVPGRLEVEQIIALEEWLESERETLDVSQVP